MDKKINGLGIKGDSVREILPPQSLPNSSQAECGRMVRLLRMVQEIRTTPNQPLNELLKRHNISRSQFYKDRAVLAELGFKVEYRARTGFHVFEDRLTPVTDFSLSDRVVLMFALEHLSACAEGHLAAQAIAVGRKLATGLTSPFKEQLQACFDRRVTEDAFGVQPHVLVALREAIAEGRWVRILYQRSETWETRWREVAPRRLYLRHRTLYLYARTQDEMPPQWKVFRLSRIKEITPTGVCASFNPHDDDGFEARQTNAFGSFIGDKPETVRIRFTGNARNYVKERIWHPSQTLEELENGDLLLSVAVAEPQEVIRWARVFGEEAAVVETNVS